MSIRIKQYCKLVRHRCEDCGMPFDRHCGRGDTASPQASTTRFSITARISREAKILSARPFQHGVGKSVVCAVMDEFRVPVGGAHITEAQD